VKVDIIERLVSMANKSTGNWYLPSAKLQFGNH